MSLLSTYMRRETPSKSRSSYQMGLIFRCLPSVKGTMKNTLSMSLPSSVFWNRRVPSKKFEKHMGPSQKSGSNENCSSRLPKKVRQKLRKRSRRRYSP
jgi:hypothetical protein